MADEDAKNKIFLLNAGHAHHLNVIGVSIRCNFHLVSVSCIYYSWLMNNILFTHFFSNLNVRCYRNIWCDLLFITQSEIYNKTMEKYNFRPTATIFDFDRDVVQKFLVKLNLICFIYLAISYPEETIKKTHTHFTYWSMKPVFSSNACSRALLKCFILFFARKVVCINFIFMLITCFVLAPILVLIKFVDCERTNV